MSLKSELKYLYSPRQEITGNHCRILETIVVERMR